VLSDKRFVSPLHSYEVRKLSLGYSTEQQFANCPRACVTSTQFADTAELWLTLAQSDSSSSTRLRIQMHFIVNHAGNTFRRVRKIAKRDYYLRHVRLSVRMEQLGFHWTDFHEILYLGFFRKSVNKIQASLKSDSTVYFT
jgi:hypothetical protein